MSDELIKSVQAMLTEEKWTRATITNYSKNNFLELSAVIEKSIEATCIDEVKAICDEHLAHTKNSIIALYISGMLSLKKKTLDDSALITLINIFVDNKKANVVTYLCELILLEDEHNKTALRTLAEIYREENSDKIWDVYTTLVKVDHDEATIAKTLAEKYEKEGNLDTAIDFYKKALLRFINKNAANQVKEVWSKLVTLIPLEIDFFLLVQRKISKTISTDKSAMLLQELYTYYKESESWDTAIEILKIILSYDEKDSWARKEIVECFRGKYSKHSKIDDYIRLSNLNQSWRNIFEAINDFEKHISFDAKNFVFHRTWGVGLIRSVIDDEVTINFGKKYGIRKMSLKMAVDALLPLHKEHIWVLKATKSRDELVSMIKKDKVWALKTIIKSFGNNCDFKKIKAELVPSVLTAGEWTSWGNASSKILSEDPSFGVNPNDISLFMVREHSITAEEKFLYEFKAQKQFFARIDILMRYNDDDGTDKNSENFTEMFNYFVGYLRSFSQVNEQVVASFLLVRRIVAEHPHLNPNLKYTFAQLFEEIDSIEELYCSFKDTKNTSIKKDFIHLIKELLPTWAEIYERLFPIVLKKEMIDSLIVAGHVDIVQRLTLKAFENHRDYRESIIFFFKEVQEEEWFKELNISYEKQLIALIHILDITYREISFHRETTENRKISRQVQNIFFKSNTLLNYLLSSDIDTVTRLYTILDSVKCPEIDKDKMTIRNRILEKNPDFKFFGGEEKIHVSKGMLVTSKMLEAKKEQLEQIMKVDIPANSKEIGEARDLGDLRENAEYKAAKERQNQLNSMAARLQDEIERAQVFDPTTITTARISFGTTVELYNTDSGKKETFTILGPWESDPANGIISYMSPLGNAILNGREDDKLSFEINEKNYNYTVKSIIAVKI
ncbi:MAG: transcription elongation factor GreA [Treponemataceae bacterium]